jgi:hypothetical protein
LFVCVGYKLKCTTVLILCQQLAQSVQEKSFEIGTLGIRWSPPRGALLLPALNQRPIEESKKGVLADFGSSKMGSQALMQVAQAKLPAANLAGVFHFFARSKEVVNYREKRGERQEDESQEEQTAAE